MKTRALYQYTDEAGNKQTNIVWFGVARRLVRGFDVSAFDLFRFDEQQSSSIFYKQTEDEHNAKVSFSEKQQSVCDSLTQRLHVIKGELWYNVSYGLPLMDKNRKKIDFDTFVLTTITNHPDVQSVISFTSQIVNRKYTCNVQIQSVYGQIDISI